MERTKTPTNNNPPEKKEIQLNRRLEVLTQAIGRANLISRMGKQYGGDRDLYQALGYPQEIEYEDFLARYARQDIAKAIIDRPVKETWRGVMKLVDDPTVEKSAFQQAWKDLNKELKLKKKFSQIDKLCSIGEYSVLLLGLNDISSREGFKKPVNASAKKLKIMYMKPYGMDKAKITTYVSKPSDPRYGLPETYTITIQVEDENTTADVIVHHSRVIHVIGDSLESEIKGIPVMQASFNRLMDIEKIVGGSAEMYWRGARPGYHATVKDDYTLTTEMEEDLINQIDEFEHNLRRIMANEGIDIEALATQISDPANHLDIQIQMISAVTGIPKRILTGSERGELSSAQDKSEYLSYVTTRREEHAEPNVIEPFVDRCMDYGILPNVDEYDVIWTDLFVLNEQERVEVGHKRATAIREYTQNPMAEYIIPPETFVEIGLGLSDHEKERVLKAIKAALEEERPLTPEEQSIISKENMAVTANTDD